MAIKKERNRRAEELAINIALLSGIIALLLILFVPSSAFAQQEAGDNAASSQAPGDVTGDN
ncbi:MAG: hypothetical protein M1371_04470 [Actinobacteria bacterium]|nr:hypothetical protein [Actinomycetota bacterium]